MKRLFFIVSIAFILSACDDGTMNQNPFIGTWEYEVIDQNWETNFSRYPTAYIFHDDTKFSYIQKNYFNGQTMREYVGTYTYDDQFLYFDCLYFYEGESQGQKEIKSYYELLNEDTLNIGAMTYPISDPYSPARAYYLYSYKKTAN